MTHTPISCALLIALSGALMACAPRERSPAPVSPPAQARYLGVETRLLEGDLVSFVVRMEGARTALDVIAYSRCAAAQYTLIRGYSFARHVRTNVTQSGGIWQAEGVYTVSPDLPLGLRNMDAEVIVSDCQEQGIPTV